jgi:hypothetical protein
MHIFSPPFLLNPKTECLASAMFALSLQSQRRVVVRVWVWGQQVVGGEWAQ